MNDNIKAKVENDILSATKEDISEFDKEGFLQFQHASQKFLDDIEIISKEYQGVVSKSSIKNKITELYKSMREDSAYTQKMLKCQHEFETALNEFLGRVIYLTYVNEDGSINFYGDVNIGELYRQATANRGRGNISASKMFEANDLQEDIKNSIERSMANKKAVYQAAIARYRRNKGEEHMNYNISKNTFYWWAQYHKTLGGWTDPIVNEGPIVEGYAGAVINEDPEVSNSKIEHSLEVLWRNHIQKDSIGAAIKGDVVLDSNGKIQFAIKSGSFSTARIRQYILLAYNMLRLNYLSPDQLVNVNTFKQLTSGGLSKMADAFVEYINEKTYVEANKIVIAS